MARNSDSWSTRLYGGSSSDKARCTTGEDYPIEGIDTQFSTVT